MKILELLKPRTTAPVARERLQILLAHERVALGPRDLVAILREEILATIAKHIQVEPEKVTVKMGGEGAVSTLEIDVEIPSAHIPALERRGLPPGRSNAA